MIQIPWFILLYIAVLAYIFGYGICGLIYANRKYHPDSKEFSEIFHNGFDEAIKFAAGKIATSREKEVMELYNKIMR